MLEQYLSDNWKHNVQIHVPMRGEKKAVLELALKDAQIMKEGVKEKEENKRERREKLATDMKEVITSAGFSLPSKDE